jgi:hypothetical protein
MNKQELYMHKDEIVRLYKEDKMSSPKLAKIYNTNFKMILDLLKKEGVVIRKAAPYLFGADNHTWKGGRILNGEGYSMIKTEGHPRANDGGYVFEHILIWEKVHNKYLPKGYVVHHLNGVKTDNRPENLVAMLRGAHASITDVYKQRIRELEAEVKLLEKALDNSQMIFKVSEN